MARGVNKVILVGNLGRDPEVRYAPGGSAVANVTLATSDSWKDKQTGENQDRTEWHRLVFFGRLAEIAEQFLRKGSQIYVEGRLQTRKWQDQQGQDRYTTEIVVGEMTMLGGRSDSYSPPMPEENSGFGDSPQKPSRPEAPSKLPEPSGDIDDDIPF